MKNNISAIIRCRNEERWIGHAIQSVLDFIDDPEIIVVDNNSSDHSRMVVRNFIGSARIKIVSIEDYTPGSALNLGITQATGEYVLVLSAHCILRNFSAMEVVDALEDHIAVFGKQTPVYQGKRITPRYLWANFQDSVKVNPYCKAENRYFLHNGLCLYKKAFLERFPFDPDLAGKEDRYWINSLVEHGHTFLYDPDHMSCEHHWTMDGNTWKGIG